MLGADLAPARGGRPQGSPLTRNIEKVQRSPKNEHSVGTGLRPVPFFAIVLYVFVICHRCRRACCCRAGTEFSACLYGSLSREIMCRARGWYSRRDARSCVSLPIHSRPSSSRRRQDHRHQCIGKQRDNRSQRQRVDHIVGLNILIHGPLCAGRIAHEHGDHKGSRQKHQR